MTSPALGRMEAKMADQTVKIVGDSGSAHRVALDLFKHIRDYAKDAEALKTTEELLELYRKCHQATYSDPKS